MNSKRVLRETFRARLLGPSDFDVQMKTRALNKRLIELLSSLKADVNGCWAGFQAIEHEPDVSEAIEAARDRQWIFPRVEGEVLGFYRPSSSEAFVISRYGIREPDPTASVRIEPADIGGLLVPGLSFDLKCNRLGRGRGYYDRALSDQVVSSTTIKIGIAFERQISMTEIPVEPFDIPMDWIVTEARVLRRSVGEVSLQATSAGAFVPERNDHE